MFLRFNPFGLIAMRPAWQSSSRHRKRLSWTSQETPQTHRAKKMQGVWGVWHHTLRPAQAEKTNNSPTLHSGATSWAMLGYLWTMSSIFLSIYLATAYQFMMRALRFRFFKTYLGQLYASLPGNILTKGKLRNASYKKKWPPPPKINMSPEKGSY